MNRITLKNLKNRKQRSSIKRMRLQQGGYERLKQSFVDTMYENMWQFINKDTIKHILKSANCKVGISHKDDVNDDDFSNKKFWNTICIKGPADEGHYVFVDATGEVTGTYENDLIDNTYDDGICHGGALTAALKSCDIDVKPLIKSPKGAAKMNQNYRAIINTYKVIINNGWWDAALKKHFYNDVEWTDGGSTTLQTQQAMKTLNAFRVAAAKRRSSH